MKLSHALIALGLLTATPALGDQPLKVVASFSILGDIVANVGGDRIALTTLVGPDGDAHVFQPSPADAKAVAGADLVIVNGLGFEGWIERLTEASGYKGPVVVASKGITPREMAGEDEGHEEHAGHDDHGDHDHDHGNVDPHAWQDIGNVLAYVDTIAAALEAADPADRDAYAANAAAYKAKLAALDARVKAAIGALPAERRKIITSHDAFGYFAAAYGLTVLAPQGVSTESEASAKGVAQLIRQIKQEKAPAVFLENITDPRLIEQIAKETGARIGGTLYSDALSGATGPASTYIAMFEHNLAALAEALGA
ncbi:metal ABC transporter solute-binding protein, Zn/Mn family [Zavarzinia compransoris]|uniref:ABC transporter substrate-binding protein n=1 Tax=Zavarzinia compransoris TaxID=1264899 RepID=A0A317ED33_9PROT|nr:zinc ABC transporter substrate-binding protein [Zavarzinia compransoris]PWR23263.1 ABC transporter substrate-binding protein [Zavarzinia compransoris]TDP46171.1 zinc/manganese transport system substrate-binding protein [Zavarzinia compransoris]